MADVVLPMMLATSADVFLGDKITVRQQLSGYRAGIDAVLLAAVARAGADGRGRILDVGAGAGTVGLCVAARLPAVNVVLVEREVTLAAIARDNIQHNGFAARMTLIEADIMQPLGEAAATLLPAETFTHVLANPPYHDCAAGTVAEDALKAQSHAMPAGALDQWARFMARTAAPGGRATMIHKADALPQILAAFASRFGGLRIFPIFPRAGSSAIRVLVEGIKGSRAPAELRTGLVLHGQGQAFTSQANEILRHGAALAL